MRPLKHLRRIAAPAAMLAIIACSDDDPGPCTMFEGQCIGLPPGELCDDDFCTDGAACATVIELENGDDLAAAAATAAPGTCIALGEGSYGAATLPSGVSVLGKAAALVTVGSLDVQAGSGATIRGVRIQGGVALAGAVLRIEAVRIEGASDAIVARGGSDVTVVDSEIAGAAQHGILALDARAVRVERTLLQDLGGPGVWTQCGTGCDCVEKPAVSLDHVLVERARHVGVSLVGVNAHLETVHVVDTGQLTVPVQLAGGGGLLASGCSELDVHHLTIDTAVSFGILVDASSGAIGNDAEALGIIIVGTKVGMWLSNIQSGITIAGADITTNQGVGIGIGGSVASKGIIIVGTLVGKTESATLLVEPAVNGEKKQVGHGFVWGGGAQVKIDGLTLAGNADASMLIDGPVAADSTLKDVTLTEGDEAKGIVQQNVMPADAAPSAEGTTPTVTRDPMKVADMPAGPEAPQALE